MIHCLASLFYAHKIYEFFYAAALIFRHSSCILNSGWRAKMSRFRVPFDKKGCVPSFFYVEAYSSVF